MLPLSLFNLLLFYGMFGWVDFMEDEKKRVENRRENEWEWVFGWEGEGERKVVEHNCFLSGPTKIQSL